MSAAGAFRGTVAAAGFVIDVPLLGEGEARRRVLDSWAIGVTIRLVPDGRWVLILPDAVAVRIERAPGLPLLDVGNILVGVGSAGAPQQAGTVVFPHQGADVTLSTAEMPVVDTSDWIDIATLPLHILRPIDIPAPPPLPIADPQAPSAPDMRSKAGVGARSPKSAKVAGEMAGKKAGGGGSRDAGRARPSRQTRGFVARMVLGSPASGLVHRRHARYLRQLTEEFDGRRWDEALRNAIGLGDGSGGGLRLRLPGRRLGLLRPAPVRPGARGSVGFGPTAHQHLMALYRNAAKQLEAEGRIAEAAFVLADLLNVPLEAVALLERHDHVQLAAELAEGRRLAPDMVVRLWWRAGNRSRAIEVARSRGAFAGAVARLVQSGDDAAARELRCAWVEVCRDASDHAAAVDAAWPDPALRPLVAADLDISVALGGPTAARMLAHLVSTAPSAENRARAMAMLDSDAGADRPLRQGFVQAWATLEASDAAADRELSSGAIRTLFRDRVLSSSGDEAAVRRTLTALRSRADPILVADLPALPRPVRPGSAVMFTAPPEPGRMPVLDAVVLDGSRMLVALGEAGVRLLTLDGRVAARWDVPADQLVVADSAAQVLLVTRRGRVCEFHRLHVPTRRISRWVSVAARHVVPSYDGGLAIVVDDHEISFLDTLDERPRALWRELDATYEVHDISRSPTALAALIRVPQGSAAAGADLQVWRWDIPTVTLRARWPLALEGIVAGKVTANGHVLVLRREGDQETTSVAVMHGASVTHSRPIPDATESAHLLASGDVTAVVHTQGDGARIEIGDGPDAVGFFEGARGDAVEMRAHAGVVTVWDATGRIVAIDLAQRTVLASLRTTT